ncbi:SOS response-associated peptidase [Natrialbaceae archaeon A-CW3]
MCGRYTLFLERGDLEERFDARFPDDDSFEPRYNMSPGQRLPVITHDDPDAFQRLEWGLCPAWADEETSGIINARAETVAEKRSFRTAYALEAGDESSDYGARRLAAGRCLVPANGFYEWVETDTGKQPYRVAFADDRPFAMAGLWERWKPERTTTQTGLEAFGGGASDASDDPEPEVIETFTVVTTEPNAVVGDLHHRMAAILEPAHEREWLTADDPSGLLEPYPAEEMRAYPVSTAVNSPAVDEPSLVEPLEG